MFFYFGLTYTTIYLEGITIFYYACKLLLEILENIQSTSTAISYVLIITIDFFGLNSKLQIGILFKNESICFTFKINMGSCYYSIIRNYKLRSVWNTSFEWNSTISFI